MTSISIDGLRRHYDSRSRVGPVSFDVEAGEFFSLLGPSGCGKSTCLRCIAGFERPDAGTILVGGLRIEHLPPHKRQVGIVFQSFALFPHLSVQKNVEFGLRISGRPTEERARRARVTLGLVGLEHLADRYPGELSGGQQQRVAVARALVMEPPVLLMDEPLSSLDLKLRVQMRAEIRRLQRELGLTLIYVTHDQDEALSMSDRIAVMAGGRIAQIGTPRQIYDRPASLDVASFIGTANLFDVVATGREDGRAVLRVRGGLTLPAPAGEVRAGDRVAIRPERVRVVPADAPPDRHGLGGTIASVEFLGADIALQVRVGDGVTLKVDQKSGRRGGDPGVGDPIRLAIDPEDLVILPGPGPDAP